MRKQPRPSNTTASAHKPMIKSPGVISKGLKEPRLSEARFKARGMTYVLQRMKREEG